MNAKQFFDRVVFAESGCWEWIGSRNRDGYGTFSGTAAHRLAIEIFRGPITPGLEIDHLCRNRCCVRPDHLEVVTHAENVRRSEPATKTHCVNGHEYTPGQYLLASRKRREPRLSSMYPRSGSQLSGQKGRGCVIVGAFIGGAAAAVAITFGLLKWLFGDVLS